MHTVYPYSCIVRRRVHFYVLYTIYPPSCIAVTYNIASVSKDKTVRIWSLKTGIHHYSTECNVAKWCTIDGTKVYCINPIIRILTFREQWGRFDVENNKPDRSVMVKGTVFGNVLKDSMEALI